MANAHDEHSFRTPISSAVGAPIHGTQLLAKLAVPHLGGATRARAGIARGFSPTARSLLALVLAIAALSCGTDAVSDGSDSRQAGRLLTASAPAARQHPRVPRDLQGRLRATSIQAIQASANARYDFAPVGDSTYQASTTAFGGISVDDGGTLSIGQHAAGTWQTQGTHGRLAARLRLSHWGSGASLEPAPATTTITATGNAVQVDRGAAIRERYSTGRLGVEQSFVLASLPPTSRDASSIELGLEVDDAVATSEDGIVALRPTGEGGGAPVLYGELAAWDANGRMLDASLRTESNQIRITVGIDGHVALPITVDPLLWTEQQQISRPGSEGEHQFSRAVAIDGDTAVIGAPMDGNGFTGAAYVYTRKDGTWNLQQALKASDGTSSDFFGASVDIVGDRIIVGAKWEEHAAGIDEGAAYVFSRSGTTWTQQAKLVPSVTIDREYFGSAVAISRQQVGAQFQYTAVVGAPANTAGAAYVFFQGAGAWAQQQKLSAPAPHITDAFGASVDVMDHTAVVGDPSYDAPTGADAGRVYAYTRVNNVWSLQQQIAGGSGSGEFGTSISLSLPRLLIGEPGRDAPGPMTNVGTAYTYERSGSTWGFLQTLVPSDLAPSQAFGYRVSLGPSDALIGSGASDDGPGIYIFNRWGVTFDQHQKLTIDDAGEYSFYGASLALSGTTAIIGSPGEDDFDGPAFVFEGISKTATGWPCSAASECFTGFCVDGRCCNTACDAGVCDTCAGGVTSTGNEGYCAPTVSGTTCRAAIDQCDAAETCTGSTLTCPADAKQPNGVACSDTNACTQTDACQAGVCSGSNPVVCPAPGPCHEVGACDSGTGICSPVPKPDGASCSDGDACTTGDSCAAASCQPGAPAVIDDGNPCTIDACDPVTGTTHSPVAPGTACSDGEPCNGVETCTIQGQCAAGPPLSVGASCSDDNPCTAGDVCSPSGQCQGTVITGSCSDGDSCNGDEVCQGGVCVGGVPPPVDDGEDCTLDWCDGTTGVHHSACSTLSGTVSTSVHAASEFLYSGSDPVQLGVAPGIMDPLRVAVIRGTVRGPDGAPLPGAVISVRAHPEFGETISRGSGEFDIAVNGGGLLTVVFQKEGFIEVQRQVNAPWQGYVQAEPVVLLPYDTSVTTIDLGLAAPFQVARGSVVPDADGTRQATMLFESGTAAAMVLPGGGTLALDELHVRATEFTVGPNGLAAMPGALPPSSGYTYAVELSADEAVAAGATSVEFSKPVRFYVENFRGFPVGERVPVGYYDRERGLWVPSSDGRVVGIVGEDAGMASLDIDGDDVADSAAALSALGITDAERQYLASIYDPGQSLWRASMPHFTPWDLNWPFGPPTDACTPGQGTCPLDEPENADDAPETECEKPGSVIGCLSQSLGEALPVAGTPFRLKYRSDRLPANGNPYRVKVPLTGSVVPPSLLSVTAKVEVAGRELTTAVSCPCNANQSHTFEWDGKDVYGNQLQGKQATTVAVGYEYPTVYYSASGAPVQSFTAFVDGQVTLGPGRKTLTLWKKSQLSIGAFDTRPLGLGGWLLDVHHTYDVVGGTLYLGTGKQRRVPATIRTVAGGGLPGQNYDSGPALGTWLPARGGHAIGPDGSIYIGERDTGRVRRILPNGTITKYAGINQSPGLTGDGGPATSARVNPSDVALGPDGSLFIAEGPNHRVRRIAPDGIITTFAGSTQGFSGDNGPATSAKLSHPGGVAVAADGSVYICDVLNQRVRRVSPSGIITTIAGNGLSGPDDNDVPATSVGFHPTKVAIGPDGVIYVAENIKDRVRRIEPTTGLISLATTALLYAPADIDIGPDGSLYVATSFPESRVRKVSPGGLITTVAGNGIGDPEYQGEGGLATQAIIMSPASVAVWPDGRLTTFKIGGVERLLSVFSPLLHRTSTGDAVLAAATGTDVFVFDGEGRHLSTKNAYTGAIIYAFGYDPEGRLVTITDAYQNVTEIMRDGSGKPTAIQGPYGHITTLTLDANDFLGTTTNPASEQYAMTYTSSGRLLTFEDPRHGVAEMDYDLDGRLILDEDPGSGSWSLVRTELPNGHSVQMTSAMGRQSHYTVEELPGGSKQNTTTFPSGLSASRQSAIDGSSTTTLPDGTVVTTTLGPDPRFGMLAPVETLRRVTTPAGKQRSVATTRTATLSDPADPASFSALTTTTTINGKVFTKSYDAATRTLTRTSAAGRTTAVILDPKGRPSVVTIAGLVPTEYAYDSFGRIESVTQSNRVATRTYDGSGSLDTITDPMLHVTLFDHDLVGRPTLEERPDNNQVTATYDDAGSLASLTPPGHPAHEMAYTAVDLLGAYNPPTLSSGATPTTWAYNFDQQIDLVTRADATTIDYAYDAAGRLTSAAFPSGVVTREYHSATGWLESLTGPDGFSLTFGHDGNLPTSVSWSGPFSATLTRAHDNDFRVGSETINGSNAVVFEYDDDGLITGAGALTIARDPQNSLVTATTLENITESYQYNSFGELADYHAKHSGNTLLHVVYTRDDLGRITSKTETVDGATSVYEYGFDDVGRLETVAKNDIEIAAYAYDANGNRLSKWTAATGTVSLTHDEQDRVETNGTRTYTYAPTGALESIVDGSTGESTGYTFDALGNLKSVELPTGTTVDYSVDGEMHRVVKRVEGLATRRWIWNGELTPAAELDANGSVVSRFVYGAGINVPDFILKGGATFKLIKDHTGSVRMVVDALTGAVAQRIEYDEFGDVLSDSAPGFQPFGFAGGFYDADTNLVRFGSRDYDATCGRWIDRDPYRFRGGDTNLYSYGRNDPVNYIDVNGRIPIPLIIAVVAGVVAGGLVAVLNEDAKKIKKHADDFAVSQYDGSSQCMFLGPGDALKHCVASCELTKFYGEKIANAMLDINEVKGNIEGATDVQEEQDVANNACGVNNGLHEPSCTEACLEDLLSGELVIYNADQCLFR